MTPGTLMTPARSFRNFLSVEPFRLFHRRPLGFFEDPFTPFRPFLPTEETLPLSAWTPPCDIYETEKELVLKMELPDMKKEDVHVTIENNVLSLRGERNLEEKVERENYHRIERNYGEFFRSFTLPNFVEGNKIVAEFKDGMLTVTLPKTIEARPKEIEVKVK
jgi:HSP20 family protein